MRLTAWISDVCSSVSAAQRHDLDDPVPGRFAGRGLLRHRLLRQPPGSSRAGGRELRASVHRAGEPAVQPVGGRRVVVGDPCRGDEHTVLPRSEEHTPELQSLMPISYAVIWLKKKI